MFYMSKLRKQRRLEAKLNGVSFEPQYNGKAPATHKELTGVGNERFNNKFFKFDSTLEQAESRIESLNASLDENTSELSEAKQEEEEEVKKSNRFMTGIKNMFGKK